MEKTKNPDEQVGMLQGIHIDNDDFGNLIAKPNSWQSPLVYSSSTLQNYGSYGSEYVTNNEIPYEILKEFIDKVASGDIDLDGYKGETMNELYDYINDTSKKYEVAKQIEKEMRDKNLKLWGKLKK